jgi:cyclase
LKICKKRADKPLRIIPILDIKNGLLIKGINLEGLRVMGKAENFANHYYLSGADEICYIDNVATLYGTNNLTKFVTNTAKKVYIPLTVGGGIRNLQDIQRMLTSGADKVCINSAVIDDINFLKKASRLYGSSNITVIIQSIKINGKYFISKSNGRDFVKINPIDWAQKVENYGAGEIIITSINNEGIRKGFDIDLAYNIARKLDIPVIAHGGAGNFKDVYEVAKYTSVSGVAIASLFHYEAINYFPKLKTKIGNTFFIDNLNKSYKKKNMILELKKYLDSKGVLVRL